nr:MAG: hypothetical protein DIU57_19780 [Pseudomonadota bacterium]
MSDRVYGTIKQNDTPPLRVYIEDESGTPLKQSDVVSIHRKIYDLDSDTPTTAIDESDLEVSETIYDELQPWTADSTGYNFMDVVKGGHFTLPNRRYEVVYRITTSAGLVIHPDPFELKTIRTF